MTQEMESLLSMSYSECDPPQLILALHHLQYLQLMTTPCPCTFSFLNQVTENVQCWLEILGTLKLVFQRIFGEFYGEFILCKIFAGNPRIENINFLV